jgi:hypothetical protein
MDDAKQLGVINPDEISDFVRVLTMAIALYAMVGAARVQHVLCG